MRADRSPTTMEHRLGIRIPLSLLVRLDQQSETAALGRMLNVSLSGAYLATSRTYELLSRIDIVCGRFSDARADVSGIAAYVVRKAGGGVGVEWCEFAPPAIRRLVLSARAWRRARISLGQGGCD